jgi:hypothetical protein
MNIIYTRTERRYIILFSIIILLIFLSFNAMNTMVNFGIVSSKYYFIQNSNYENMISDESWILCIFLFGIFLFNLKGIYKSYKNSINFKKYIVYSIISLILIILYSPASCPIISFLHIPPNSWIMIDLIGAIFAIAFLVNTIHSK